MTEDRRTARNNPFTPGYGAVPEVFAGRRAEFAEFDDVLLPRLRDGVYEQARLVTGDRGVGKTVFLLHLEQDAREAGDWPVRVSARPGEGVVADLLQRLAEALDAHHLARRLSARSLDALRLLAGIRVGPEGIGIEVARPSGATIDRGAELSRLLVEAGRLAAERGAVLLVLVDEAQNIAAPALADLCHALQEAQSTATLETAPNGARVRRHLPIGVYVAGLPGVVGQLQQAGATFFERSRHLDFGLLGDADVREGLVAFAANRDVAIDAPALDRLVELVQGYPYFLHLIGHRVWTAGTGPVITVEEVDEGYAIARADLDGFYAERLRGLGDLQHDWLRAAAAVDDADRTTGAVAARLGRRSSQLGSTVRALVDRGLIRMAPGRGRFEFGLPGLAGHLRADR
ncbi:ATP-binding protein [Euzebya sp.]|uniref:ATP-binding protein n=1 Tax=Euzebya sp. TaxID=1971409 RepID=UPI003514E997